MSESDDRAKVVAIGGGHGLSATVAALSMIPEIRFSAIVGTTDNGGSTGAIRRWANCIAWGDLRHVINSLSEYATPSLQTLLFEHRFGNREGALSGHSLGNIILHALEDLAPRPQAALDLVTHWLGIEARIIPMSEEPAELVAEAGSLYVEGEEEVDAMDVLPERLGLSPQVEASPEAVEALQNADMVILGPGSVMTSVVPSLLVDGIRKAIIDTAARKIWIQNSGREEGPMGTLGPSEVHQWLRGILGFQYADTILVDEQTELSDPDCDVIAARLCGEEQSGRYGPEALSSAYRDLLKL